MTDNEPRIDLASISGDELRESTQRFLEGIDHTLSLGNPSRADTRKLREMVRGLQARIAELELEWDDHAVKQAMNKAYAHAAEIAVTFMEHFGDPRNLRGQIAAAIEAAAKEMT